MLATQIARSRSGVVRALAGTALLLVLASTAGQLCKYLLGHGRVFGLVQLFYVDGERNVPTLFSVGMLVFAAWHLLRVALALRRRGGADAAWWALLAVGFLGLAVDEAFSLHERLSPPVAQALGEGPLGIFHYAWVVPGLIGAAIAAALFRRFLLRLPAATRRGFVRAASLFLGGALGVELVGGAWASAQGEQNLAYSLLATLEESLEMAGVIVFVHVLLRHVEPTAGSVSGSGSSPSPIRRWSRETIGPAKLAAVVSFGAVLAVGIVRLPLPFHGDTALFTQGAEALSRGAVLYDGFWDNKQPGIYWFFEAAGGLFGFDEVGVHLFELAYWLVFAALFTPALARRLEPAWLGWLFPLVTVVPYLAYGTSWHATQLEALVGFPLFVLAWQLARPPTGRFELAQLGAGLAAGCVLLFKLALAPVVVSAWLLAVVHWRRGGRSWGFVLGRATGPLVLGALVPLAAAVGYFASHGLLDELGYVSFGFPVEALAVAERAPLSRVVDSLRWFVAGFGGLGLIALLSAVRPRDRAPSGGRALAAQMVAWLVGAALAIGAQGFSYWPYHFTIFAVPIGVLALLGLEAAHARWRSRLVVALVLVVALLPALRVTGGAVVRLALAWRQVAGSEQGWLDAYRGANGYEQGLRAVQPLLAPDALPGPIYVFGNPVLYTLSHRRQALPIHGWAWEIQPERMWRRLADQLPRAAPAYVFIDDDYAPLVTAQSPSTLELLRARYEAFPTRPDVPGHWWARKPTR